MKQYLGAERRSSGLTHGIWQDETNEHVDNVCAFARPGEVLLALDGATRQIPSMPIPTAVWRSLEQGNGRRRAESLWSISCRFQSRPVLVTEADLGGYEFEEGEDRREAGERLAASYVNFYLSNGGVIVPQFGDEADQQALEILKDVFPERRIYPIHGQRYPFRGRKYPLHYAADSGWEETGCRQINHDR